MNPAQNQLSLTQFVFLIYKTQVGFSVLVLPRLLMEEVNTDGWMTVIIGCFLSILCGIIIVKVMEKHPQKTLYEILPLYFGKWLGRGVMMVWITYTLFAATVAMFSIIYLIRIWILPHTHLFLLTSLLLVPIYYIVVQGIKVIGRYAEFVFIFTVWMPYMLFFSLQDVDWLNLLPLFKNGLEPILLNVHLTFSAFYGFELVFIWYSFLNQKKKAIKGIIIANILTLIVMLIVVISCFVEFSELENTQSVWPTLNLLKLIQFPFLERLEVIFLSIYLYVLFGTVIPYLYTSLLGMVHLFNQKSKRFYQSSLLFILITWLLIVMFFFPTYHDLSQLQTYWVTVAFYMVFVFSIVFVIYQWFLYKLGKVKNE